MKLTRHSLGLTVLGAAALTVSTLGAQTAFAESMSLKSGEVSDGATIKEEQVFKGFGCTGGNHLAGLSWSGAPSATKSFAVSIYDPDAPTGSGWWHWVVFNIPAATTSVPKNAGDLKAKLMPRARSRAEPILAAPAMAVPARRWVISRITTLSPCSRLMKTSWNTRRMITRRRPSSALRRIFTPSEKRA